MHFQFLSNRNIYYVIELPFVFGDILILCYLFKQKDSIFNNYNHYILFFTISYSQFLNLYLISPKYIKSYARLQIFHLSQYSVLL